MFLGQSVRTPYGLGRVSEIRLGSTVVIPLQWLMAGGQKPTFFMNNKDVNPLYAVGSSVQCSFGAGVVQSIRNDGIYVVQLTNWKLADGKSPTLYLNESSLSLPVPVAPVTGKDPSLVDKVLAKSLATKEEAGDFFKKGDIETARIKYLDSVEQLQHFDDDLTNEQKAKVFEQSVLINNNISLCCLRLKGFSEARDFGRNALMLINTLEERIPVALVWQALVKDGMTLDKYHKEWKKKAYFFVGKAEMGLNNYQSALDNLKAALALIQNDATLNKQIDELKTLISQVTAKLAAEKKKERATWSKAFEKGKKEEMYSDPVSPATAAAPKKSESTNSFNGANGNAKSGFTATTEDDEVTKIVNSALGKKSVTPAASATATTSATDNSALWKPDSISIALVLGSFFALCGGYYFWTWTRRRW